MYLLLTDLHWTDKPQDEYRWPLVDWVVSQIAMHKVDHVFCLGDITDAKNNHSATLVNRVVKAFARIAKRARVTIIKGNHDYIDPDNPYFGFLNWIPGVDFVVHPVTDALIDGKHFMFLPHTRQPELTWKSLDFGKSDYIFMHQTVGGALASNGYRLDGFSPKLFGKEHGDIYSGDIHTPQKVGRINYVGSPYHVVFGDTWEGRCQLLSSGGETTDLFFPTLCKHVLDVADAEDLNDLRRIPDGTIRAGDQVKIRIHLSQSELVDWNKHKSRALAIASENEWDVHVCELKGPGGSQSRRASQDEIAKVIPSTVKEVYKKYCKEENVDRFKREVGEDICDAVQESGN